jgi:hypothetical protein
MFDFFFLAILGFELGLTLAMQVLYYLSNALSLFFFCFNQIGSHVFTPGLGTWDLRSFPHPTLTDPLDV